MIVVSRGGGLFLETEAKDSLPRTKSQISHLEAFLCGALKP